MVAIDDLEFDHHVELASFINDRPIFALADGSVILPNHSGQEVVELKTGELLCATRSLDKKSIVLGCEDGRVLRASEEGLEVIAEKSGKWIDVVACGPNGAVAFASGRTVWLVTQDTEKEFNHERAVEGLDFAPKGMRFACARYNGVSLHWAAGQSKPTELQWDGAHTDVIWSPDGKYIISGMAENALHGWRLDNKASAQDKHMRMTGYPAKPKSLSWSPKGKWLASSGAQSAVCWPFSGKDGPMGKAPKELGTRGDSMVVQVACHPTEDVVAIGYADGMIMAVKIDDAAEAVLRKAGKGSITTLTWDNNGHHLAFGSEEGEAGIVRISS